MTRAFEQIGLQNREDDSKAVAALKNQGIEFITPDKAIREEWIKTAGTASQKMVDSGTLPKEAVDKMDRLLKEFHTKGSN
jgi:hypothetical protein